MEVNAASTATAASTSTDASKSLADNFDTFLTLLTTQLKNQDPLEPMDSNEFTQQLVQFSSVEQAIATNTNLESLIKIQQATQATNIVSYLGTEIEIAGNITALADGSAEWQYYVPQDAASTDLVVSDANGKVVFTGSGQTAAGEHTFTWDGKDNFGNQLSEGLYSIQVTARDTDGDTLKTFTFAKGVVDGIDTSGAEPVLIVGDLAVPLANVIKVSKPAK